MALFVIFKTNKESGETQIAGQTQKGSVPQQSQLVKQITGQKPGSAIRTSNSSTFNTEDCKVDFIDKDSLGGGLPL